MRKKPYSPVKGSLAYRVLEFFASNPSEELSVDDIAIKYEVKAAHVHSELAEAVSAQLLRRVRVDLDYHYKEGELKNPVAPAAAGPAGVWPAATKKARRGSFSVDLEKVEIEEGIPMPAWRNPVDWTTLFRKMEVGQSCLLPIQAYFNLAKQATAWKKNGSGTFAIRKLDTQKLRLWRTE